MRARDNPFQATRIERVRYRFDQGNSWDRLFNRLQALANRGALVGPEGSGKTTLLEELHTRVEQGGYRGILLQARPDVLAQVRAQRITKTDFFLLDSAERLTWTNWQRFKWATRAAGGLVLTSHRPDWLPTLIECRTTPGLFAEIVQELLAPDVFATIPPGYLREVFAAHRGNIRAALRELYDGAADPVNSIARGALITQRQNCQHHLCCAPTADADYSSLR